MNEGKKLFPLAQIVFPDADFAETQELFYRFGEEDVRFPDGTIKACKTISFDTWMNLFAAGKWHRFCELGKLFLELQVRGNFHLQITGHEFTAAFGVVDRALLGRCYGSGSLGEFTIEIPSPADYAGISFRLAFPEGEDYALGNMRWCTDAAPKRQSRIAIVTCTFRREDYVRKTIRKFTEFIGEEEGRGERFHLFVVDNGRTLEKRLENDHVTILPNKNAGGAGGFCRGLMEANDGEFTHCLFMDDDVEICPESFFRTLALVDFLRDEYRTCSVNGPMMNLYDKTELFENLAAYDGAMGFRTCRGPMRVESVGRVLESIDLAEEMFHEGFLHSAWWYTCCSLERYKEEYPVPVFFRCDDVEWSWRKQGMEIISMNGICLWHAPFQWRVGKMADCYYWPRNMLLLCALYQQGRKARILAYLQNRFGYLLRTLDYVGAEVFLMAVTDFLKGKSTFEEAPDVQMQRVRATCARAKVRKDVDYMELDKAGRHALETESRNAGVSLDWYPPEGDFKSKERVDVYNLSGRTCEPRLRDEGRADRLEREFDRVLLVLSLRFRDLCEEMEKGYEKFRTRAFWEDYLGIKRGAGECR